MINYATTLLSRCKITFLTLTSCILPGTTSTTLKCIIEELNNSPLEFLALTNSHINITHVHYLILLVHKQNSNLISLNLSDSDLNKAMPLLSSALIHSKIIEMHLEECNIDDDGLYCLFEVLRHRTFCMIDIDDNPQITALGLKKCLSMLLEVEHSHPTLYYLYLSTKSLLNEENKMIIQQINSIRRIKYRRLNVTDGPSTKIEDELTEPEAKLVQWAANQSNLLANQRD